MLPLYEVMPLPSNKSQREATSAIFISDEKILSAALRLGKLIVSMPNPHRHCHIMYEMDFAGIGLVDILKQDSDFEEGFLTTHGRFVGRDKGLEIAKREGQWISDGFERNELFSEDVWR